MNTPPATLKYLNHYPSALQAQVHGWLAEGSLGERLAKAYPAQHNVRDDKALYDYVLSLKNQYLRGADPLAKVMYDNKLKVVAHALGTHTMVSRVQGGKLKAKRELRVASVFKQAPEAFLNMIVVHELAHLKEREHNKAFYKLCEHMNPQYHHHELDFRIWLTWFELTQRTMA